MLGVGLVTPLLVMLGSLHLPSGIEEAAMRQHRFFEYTLHPFSLFLQAVVIFPLWEETFYRGMILQLLRRYVPTWFAVLITTLFFGATHLGQGWTTALNATLLGGIFAWLTMRTNSVIPSMLCHAAFNFTWFFLLGPAFGITDMIVNYTSGQAIHPPSLLTGYFPAWWMIISLGLVIAGRILITRDVPKAPAVI